MLSAAKPPDNGLLEIGDDFPPSPDGETLGAARFWLRDLRGTDIREER